ncbi:DUF1127 domain-containing protein [Pseudomonas sp. R47(2017)]|uniref:DUF1127 domain-containing protein n=1 Tax=unclassified Pseudomonas TaxID=196821 RepID=UPI003530C444
MAKGRRHESLTGCFSRYSRTLSPLRSCTAAIQRLLARPGARQDTRRLLAQLDGRELADLGLSHADRLNELEKPFWR